MRVRYDSDADVVFVILRDPEGGERLDERRYAHFDQADHVFAYEFLFVSAGRLARRHRRSGRLADPGAIDSIRQLAVA